MVSRTADSRDTTRPRPSQRRIDVSELCTDTVQAYARDGVPAGADVCFERTPGGTYLVVDE